MTNVSIDADVSAAAKRFGLDPRLVQAVVNAEGNIVRAVAISIPTVTTREQALDVTCRSAVHAMCDWVKADAERQREYVAFWAARWAPVGASNDPHALNQFWPSNVLRGWIALPPPSTQV